MPSSPNANAAFSRSGRQPDAISLGSPLWGHGKPMWGGPPARSILGGETLSFPSSLADTTLVGSDLTASLNGRISAGIGGLVVIGLIAFYVYTRSRQN